MTSPGATPSAASGSRIDATPATIPGSITMSASPSRTNPTVEPTRNSSLFPDVSIAQDVELGHRHASFGRTYPNARRSSREADVVRSIPRASVRGFEPSDRGWRRSAHSSFAPTDLAFQIGARRGESNQRRQSGSVRHPRSREAPGFTGVGRETLQLRWVPHGPHDVQLRHHLLAPHELAVQAPARSVVVRSVAAPRVSRTLVV